MQRLLQVHDDLAAVGKHQGQHAAHTLAVNISLGFFVDAVTGFFHRPQQRLALVQEFNIGHYNFAMLHVHRILVRAIALASCTAALAACGQRGPLYLPTDAAAQNRATLPQTVTPQLPGSPAATPPATPVSPAPSPAAP